MNEAIGSAGNAVFADLAYGLAERGIASIRYNKRYYQYPQTATPTLTVWDEVINDANAAIALARITDGIDKNKIFIIGHSLGGILAPEIAKENPDIAGLVSLAGSPRKLEDIILDQNKAAIGVMNNTDAEKQAIMDSVLTIISQVKALTPQSPHSNILSINSEYWLSLNQASPDNIVKNLAIPMLFLQGSADFQVSPESDFGLWQSLLQGHKNAQFKLYPGLNHLFMMTNGKADLSEYNTKANVEEEVIADIAKWIHL
jgi:dienelactone hydrolase